MLRIMKRSLYILAFAVALTGCLKEEYAPEVQNPDSGFAVYCEDILTKTINAGMTTIWDSGDRINLFHAPTGTSEYMSDGRYNCTQPSIGLFTPNSGNAPALDETASYDWWAYFRYNSNCKSPEKTQSILLGPDTRTGMTQEGNDSMAHLCGNKFVMVGRAMNVSGAENPRIQMKHVNSLLAFKITNDTPSEMTVKEIYFTAPYEVCGYFYVNFVGEEPVLTASNDDNLKTGMLVVENGEAIAPGESAFFYMAIAPMTVKADETISVKTVAEVGDFLAIQTFDKVLTEETKFASGGMKTMDLKFTKNPLDGVVVTEDDFQTFNLGLDSMTMGDYYSTDGWLLNNGCAWIGEYTEWMGTTKYAAVLNGKTSAPGVLTSPVIQGGIDVLTFDYGVNFTDGISFKVEVFSVDSGFAFYSETITQSAAEVQTKYSFTSPSIMCMGNFYIVFTNLCPSGLDRNADRVGIFNVNWTGFEMPDFPFPM